MHGFYNYAAVQVIIAHIIQDHDDSFMNMDVRIIAAVKDQSKYSFLSEVNLRMIAYLSWAQSGSLSCSLVFQRYRPLISEVDSVERTILKGIMIKSNTALCIALPF